MSGIEKITIFTDGASKGNPGKGGWGAIVASPDGQVKELGAFSAQASNNQMEMTGVIEGLASIASIDGPVVVYTDSSYVINGITNWIHNWKRNSWRTSQGDPVKNTDLWQQLDTLVRARKTRNSSVDFQYTPGHSGIPGNERVDTIASEFALGEKPDLFIGDLANYSVSLYVDPQMQKKKKSASKSSRSGKKAHSYLSLVQGKLMIHRTWAECESRVKGVAGARFKKALNEEDENQIRQQWGV